MRVLHIITSLGVGGAEVMLRNITLGLDSRRFEQRVVCLKENSIVGTQIEARGIPVVALDGRISALLPWRLHAVKDIVRDWRPQIIHAWMYHANVVAYLTAGAAGGTEKPTVIASIRGALSAPRAQRMTLRMVRTLDARMSGRARAVLFNSHASALQHNAIGYDSTKNIVIPNGFDTRRFSPDLQVRARVRAGLGLTNDIAIGMVARYEPVKGHHMFVRAAAGVARRNNRCRFVLVGRNCDARNHRLRDQLEELGIGDATILLGEREDVPEIFNALDVAVCSSLSESFPNAIGEAMASGVPSAVMDVGDCSFLVGDTGRVVAAANVDALAAAILELAELTPAERASLGARARSRIEANFSIDGVIRQYSEMYERLA